MKKRSYVSEARDAQALKTKSHILEAAKTLFKAEGFDRVTIQKLALTADVSMPTIYALFKSKRGVLQALIDEALPQEQFLTLVEASMQEKSPRKRLLITAKIARHIYDAEREVIDILRGAAMVSSELKELEDEREKRRYDRQEEFIALFWKEKSLAKGITFQKARDILWTLSGRDLYRMLVLERRWSSDHYETWLGELLATSLLIKANLALDEHFE